MSCSESDDITMENFSINDKKKNKASTSPKTDEDTNAKKAENVGQKKMNVTLSQTHPTKMMIWVYRVMKHLKL